MGRTSVRVGQVWQSEKDGARYLVTRLYNEVLATIAVLRHTDDDHAEPVRVKVKSSPNGQILPGFKPAESSDH
jgi:hypothetical protein